MIPLIQTFVLASLLALAPTANRPPIAATPPRVAPPTTVPSTGDPVFDALRKQFGDLSAWLRSKPALGPDERREISGFRTAALAYASDHPENAAVVGMLIQAAVWLDDDEAVDAGFRHLAELRPEDGNVYASWANFYTQRFDYLTALSKLEKVTRDRATYTRYPKVALQIADALIMLNRFDEATESLDLINLTPPPGPNINNEAARLRGISTSCALLWPAEQALRDAEAAADDLPRVEFTTNRGRFVLELFENQAPNHVANFIDLVEKEFYNGTRFHRVIQGFMAQGGDPNTKAGGTGAPGTGGPGYRIAGEQTAQDARKHFVGSLAMAHSGDPDSGGSQFYICFGAPTHLNGVHTVFGRVVEGLPEFLRTKQDDSVVSAKVLRKRDHPYVPATLAPLPPAPPPVPSPGGRTGPPTHLVPSRDPSLPR